jgi:hypothetical protein
LRKRHYSMLDKRNDSVTVAHQPHTGIGRFFSRRGAVSSRTAFIGELDYA